MTTNKATSQGVEEVNQEPKLKLAVVEPEYFIGTPEAKELSKMCAVIDTHIDTDKLIADAQAMLKRLSQCEEYDNILGHKHLLPMIKVNGTKLSSQITFAQRVLTVANLRKFKKGGYVKDVAYKGMTKGELQTIVYGSDGYAIEVVGTADMIKLLDDVACWIHISKKGDEEHKKPTRDVMLGATASHLPYPMLRAAIASPRWSFDPKTRKFHVASEIGYDQGTATFITKDFGIKRSTRPTAAQVKAALAVFEDLIGQFPFSSDADKRNGYAYLLTLPIRNVFTTAPLFPVSAEDPDSGKTLFVQTCNAACFGILPEPVKLAYKEGEQERRNLTAVLVDEPGTMDSTWFDEPRDSTQASEMQSSILNLLLTTASGRYVDRPVYRRHAVSVNVQRTFAMTGNNLNLNRELARRSVRINLLNDGRDYKRKEDELMAWAMEQQGAFHQAVAVLIDNWVAKGRPVPKYRFNSFNTWLEFVGGILEAAGIVGLRENPDRVAPYTAAKADFMFWIHDHFLDTGKDITTVTAEDLQKELKTDAVKQTVLDLLEQLIHWAGKDHTAVWANLFHRVDAGTEMTIMLSKAMGVLLAFQTSETTDGRLIHGKRLERGGGTGGVSYRFTTTNKRLDQRKGTGNNQHTQALTPLREQRSCRNGRISAPFARPVLLRQDRRTWRRCSQPSLKSCHFGRISAESPVLCHSP